MSMHSMVFTSIFILGAALVVGGLYVAVRLFGGRAVDKDHTADPYAPRPEGFGSSDRELAATTEEEDESESKE